MTWLCGENPDSTDRYWQSGRHLSVENYEKASKLMICGYALLFCVPGVPCVYYGDEIGMQGYRDPFNRGYFNWQNMDTDILVEIKKISEFRHKHSQFKDGKIHFVFANDNAIAFVRYDKHGKEVLVAVNRSEYTETFWHNNIEFTMPPMDYILEVIN